MAGINFAIEENYSTGKPQATRAVKRYGWQIRSIHSRIGAVGEQLRT